MWRSCERGRKKKKKRRRQFKIINEGIIKVK
jgi:hypothetical protein